MAPAAWFKRQARPLFLDGAHNRALLIILRVYHCKLWCTLAWPPDEAMSYTLQSLLSLVPSCLRLMYVPLRSHEKKVGVDASVPPHFPPI